ncbi:glycosyltransferase [Massilia pseudoviolaceinigra]|uniref:glycosyltransferase n=1 Tax=Massilia pseudoviolaceinigra TaxID=3057165 RepID=UPI0027965C3A|nr:glycosyltransferase [Massilia sp. CCM 9206]MDQ1919503.1 glycosyltransferase [Massilia sp. CCM 9206]
MNIFAICYYAPPKLTPQAIQIGRQLYHLDGKVTMLHGQDAEFPDAYDQYPDFFQRVDSLCVHNPGMFLKGRLLRLARRVVPTYGTTPDGLGRWRALAKRAALAHIAAKRPDVLVSFGMPMSDHLLGLDLKRATGLPWLVHFSDPWAGNPFHSGTPEVLRINAEMEKSVIASADQVLFTSSRTLEMVMSKYPNAWRARAAVLPHAWDMENFGPAAPQAAQPAAQPLDARRVIRYIGACYGARSPEPLFKALARMLERQPGALDGVRFEFVGPLQKIFLASAALASLPPGLVTLCGQVPYRESLRLAREADALLVIDAPSASPSVFLPSKLVEYIGARRPVWGITSPGTSADLIAEWAGSPDACAAPDDIEAITRMLRVGLASLEAGVAPVLPEDVAQRFAPQRVSAALKGHMQQAIDRSRAG